VRRRFGRFGRKRGVEERHGDVLLCRLEHNFGFSHFSAMIGG
jgi:hypothetical protein